MGTQVDRQTGKQVNGNKCKEVYSWIGRQIKKRADGQVNRYSSYINNHVDQINYLNISESLFRISQGKIQLQLVYIIIISSFYSKARL